MKVLFSLLFSLICLSSVAQKSDTTHTHYRLIRGGFVEHSTSLKSNIKIKNGIARVQSGKKIVATGLYSNNERIGRWRFYNPLDSLDQVYNYSTKKIEYSAPNPNVTFEIDSLKVGDKVVYPAKVGGNYYGLYFLRNQFSSPEEFRKYPGVHKVFLIFHLDNKGKLIKYDTEVVSSSYKNSRNINLKKLKDEDFDFTPAYLNGKAIASRLVYESKLTVN